MAILRAEPEARKFANRIMQSERRLLSAGSWIEMAAVLNKPEDDDARLALGKLMKQLRIEVVPVTVEQAELGHKAYVRFGKGRNRVRLNFGDCFPYALAVSEGLPLLFKGDDFSQTDVVPAL